MSIPYDSNYEGIKVYDNEQGGDFYVVLDKDKVDKLNDDVWYTFDEIRYECAVELEMCLAISGAVSAISPDGDPTYILNFSSHLSEHHGELVS